MVLCPLLSTQCVRQLLQEKVWNVAQKDALLARKSELCYDAKCAARLRAACFMMSEN